MYMPPPYRGVPPRTEAVLLVIVQLLNVYVPLPEIFIPPPLLDVVLLVTVKPLISAWQFVRLKLELLLLVVPPVIVMVLSVATIGEPVKLVIFPVFIVNVPCVIVIPLTLYSDVACIVAPLSIRVPPFFYVNT